MQDEEEYVPDQSSEPDSFGRKMTITIDDGFHHMHSAIVSLRAAVITTGMGNPMNMMDRGKEIAAQKEANAMRHGVYQPSPTETMAEMQRVITEQMKEAGKPMNWFIKFYRERIMGHKMDITFIFDEIVNKFKVQIKYRPNGGQLIVITNGRHAGREDKIAKMICMSLDDDGIPYDIKFEDSLL